MASEDGCAVDSGDCEIGSRRSKSSGQWRTRQEHDPYVRRAQQEGWRSRAVYKLMDIDRRFHLLKPGDACLDLGAAPGGWAQYAARQVGPEGRVIAVDVLPIEPLPGVSCIRGDFTDETVFNEVLEALGASGADLVMSDMAPNISGIAAMDQPRAMHLAELAADCALSVLKPRGALVVKLFQGEGFEAFVRRLRQQFRDVKVVKPRASRPRSREMYLLARHRRM